MYEEYNVGCQTSCAKEVHMYVSNSMRGQGGALLLVGRKWWKESVSCGSMELEREIMQWWESTRKMWIKETEKSGGEQNFRNYFRDLSVIRDHFLLGLYFLAVFSTFSSFWNLFVLLLLWSVFPLPFLRRFPRWIPFYSNTSSKQMYFLVMNVCTGLSLLICVATCTQLEFCHS